ncbi:MAG: glycosyltransferase family 39 protein [Bacteroidota bacterium]|nr:glycosyltransferase family 39 protein [Bacteroidota bacterium]
MRFENYKTSRLVIWIIALATVGRLFIGYLLELGNDEVYYLTYAYSPDLSHFDHPPMVGFLIQLFTLNFALNSELFIRLGPILLCAGSSWIIYRIGCMLRDELTGLIAVVMFTASIYASVIAGTFILPDSPQLFFWLAGLFFLLKTLPDPSQVFNRKGLYWAGLFIGLAMLSKYTSVFLWVGAILYIIFYKKQWLSKKELYLGILISFLLFLPVLIWNFDNKFISFLYHSERVAVTNNGLRPDYFFTELLGEIMYNNPLVFFMIAAALIAVIRKRHFLNRDHKKLLLFIAIPIILLFLGIALFRRTLPHWTGPAYTTLILVAACWQRERIIRSKLFRPLPGIVGWAMILTILAAILGVGQVTNGWFDQPAKCKPTELGKNDVTLDLYGWHQIGNEFSAIRVRTEKKGLIKEDAPIISWRWFPAANIDFYIARPNGMKVLALGKFEDIHKYAWLNKERGGFHSGMDAWFICTSRDFKDPDEIYSTCFDSIKMVETVPVYRGGKHVMNAFVFRMKSLKPNAERAFGLDQLILNNH